MAPRRLAARLGFATLAAAVMLGLLAPAALAADEAPFELPRGTAAALTADLDGDGAREVVRIAEAKVPRPDPALDMVVEAWSLGRVGWELAGSAPLVRPAAEGGGFVSVDALTDGFGLLAWRDGGRERVLVVTGSGPDRRDGSTFSVCCLVLQDVALDADGLSLPVLEGVADNAEAVTATDMDGDGTDELVVTEPYDPPSVRNVTVLRWDGDGFNAERLEIGLGEFGGPPAIGETDGTPGREAIFGPLGDGSLVRIGVDADGGLYREAAAWSASQPGSSPWLAGAGDGLFVAQFPGMLTTWSWPRGEEPSLAARIDIRDSSGIGVLTNGDEMAIVETDAGVMPGGRGPAITWVHRSEMPPLELPPTPAAHQLMELGRREFEALMQFDFGVYPSVGPIFGGLGDGVAAYVSMGNLITLSSSGELDVRPMGAAAGGYAVGTAGVGGSWMAMSRGYVGGGPTVYLFAGGGFFGSGVSLVPTDSYLATESEGTVQMVPSATAAGPWSEDQTRRTFVPESGMQVTVTGPAGSSVVAVVDASTTIEATLDGEPRTLTLQPRTERETNQTYEAAIVVLTVAGQVYLERWDLVILREPPELSARGDTLVGELAATVSGEASTHARVLVDGRQVALDEAGRFGLRVDAGAWPRDVRVVAVDPLGTETVATLTVLGVFDYRGLPWVAIVAVVTVLAGLWLFVRTPRGVRQPMVLDDGVRLEELDAPR
jgi:hypothetical protein